MKNEGWNTKTATTYYGGGNYEFRVDMYYSGRGNDVNAFSSGLMLLDVVCLLAGSLQWDPEVIYSI